MSCVNLSREKCDHYGDCEIIMWEVQIEKVISPGISFIEKINFDQQLTFRFGEKTHLNKKHKYMYLYYCDFIDNKSPDYELLYREVFFE